MDDLSPEMIDDKIEAIEELEESNNYNHLVRFNKFN